MTFMHRLTINNIDPCLHVKLLLKESFTAVCAFKSVAPSTGNCCGILIGVNLSNRPEIFIYYLLGARSLHCTGSNWGRGKSKDVLGHNFWGTSKTKPSFFFTKNATFVQVTTWISALQCLSVISGHSNIQPSYLAIFCKNIMQQLIR